MTDLVDYAGLAEESWRRLANAGDDPAHPMRLCTLATVGAGGTAEARTMVLRGADRGLGKVWFYTDRRSVKVHQIDRNPSVAVAAFDRGEGVQLRAGGTGAVDTDGPLVDRHWSQASLSLRSLFLSDEAPGRPLAHPDPRLTAIRRALDAGTEDEARRNFAVIEVTVETIEWLQVVDEDQRRAVMRAETGWAVTAITP